VLGGRLYRVDEVAQILEIGETEVRKLINAGELIASKIAGAYRMTEGDIQAYVQAIKDRSAEEAAIKRQEYQRQRELERRRQRDPAMLWGFAQCIWCGVEPVLCTRNDRLTGEIRCEDCGHVDDVARNRGEWLTRSKDVVERSVAIIVRERDEQAEENMSFAEAAERDVQIERRVRQARATPILRVDDDDGAAEDYRASLIAEAQRRPPHWFTFRCPLCSKPQPLDRKILMGGGYPLCRHDAPHALAGKYAEEQWQLDQEVRTAELAGVPGPTRDITELFHPEMVLAVAEMEARQRNIELGWEPDPDLGDPFWVVCRCARCGRNLAVSRPQARLIGQTCCRLCPANGPVTSRLERSRVIMDFLNSHHRETAPRLEKCACGGWDVVLAPFEGEPAKLTWCTHVSEKQRVTWAMGWAERFKLPQWWSTMLSVSVHDSQVQRKTDDDDLEDLPF
jgi:excisionase family DNA binding protein